MESKKIAAGRKAALLLVFETAPPGFNIRARYRTDISEVVDFERMDYRSQLHIANVVYAWAKAHMK